MLYSNISAYFLVFFLINYYYTKKKKKNVVITIGSLRNALVACRCFDNFKLELQLVRDSPVGLPGDDINKI